MANTKIVLFYLSLLLVFTACQKETPQVNYDTDSFIGTWIKPQHSDTTITFERSLELINGAYGLSIKSDGKLIERKNKGWCGTPPISYGDFNGVWTENDSIINIDVGYWGGTAMLKWKIAAIDNNKLTIIRLEEIYEEVGK